MGKNRGKFIPALSYDWLTPLYDPLIRWTMRESTFKRHLVGQAQIKRAHRVLDLGCGTATLTILIKRAHPDSEVIGLDGDSRVLRIARAKIARTGLDIALDHGMAFDLPYPDGSFNRVLSSLLFHHLTRQDKGRTVREVFRVLRRGGDLHVADLGKPHYNTVTIPVAAGLLYPWTRQVVSPELAAFLMAISSLTVTLNTTLLKRFVPTLRRAPALVASRPVLAPVAGGRQ